MRNGKKLQKYFHFRRNLQCFYLSTPSTQQSSTESIKISPTLTSTSSSSDNLSHWKRCGLNEIPSTCFLGKEEDTSHMVTNRDLKRSDRPVNPKGDIMGNYHINNISKLHMPRILDGFKAKLDKREQTGNRRKLKYSSYQDISKHRNETSLKPKEENIFSLNFAGNQKKREIDFSSNDYLGLANDFELYKRIYQHHQFSKVNDDDSNHYCPHVLGTGGSRLLSGDTVTHQESERFFSNFFGYKSSLIFNSGYDCNLGLLSCISQRNDMIIHDERVHNSTMMGIRLARSKNIENFKHNDINVLQNILEKARSVDSSSRQSINNIFICVEALYSMEGTIAPIVEIVNLAETYNAVIIVDEAHSTGILGPEGKGLLAQYELNSHPNILCGIHTFGKALGCHGAVIGGDPILMDYLINYCYPFIYSTSPPPHSVLTMYESCMFMKDQDERRKHLKELIQLFRSEMYNISKSDMKKRAASSTTKTKTSTTTAIRNKDLVDHLPTSTIDCLSSPIQSIVIPGSQQVSEAASILQSQGFDVRPMRPPTVAKGEERLRIILHSHNSKEEVLSLVSSIKNIKTRFT